MTLPQWSRYMYSTTMRVPNLHVSPPREIKDYIYLHIISDKSGGPTTSRFKVGSSYRGRVCFRIVAWLTIRDFDRW